MSKVKHFPLSTVRIIAASLVLAAFVLLFLDFGGIFDKYLGWLPKLQFWPAAMAVNVASLMLILALTLVFGRVYCSFLCPLGITQDAIYRIRISGKKSKRFKQNWTRPLNIVRYGIAVVFMALIWLGQSSVAYLIEPYSIFGRMISSTAGKAIPVILISLVTLAVIVIMVWRSGRLWCNTVCPVGSILSVFSKRSLFRPVIDEDSCINCGLCGKGCRANCIDTVNHKVDMSRCVVCGDCLDNCSKGAISYSFTLGGLKPVGKKNVAEPAKADNGRRAFLTAGALALGSAALKADEAHGGLLPLKERKTPERAVPVVPPGAVSLKNFTSHCVTCQLCVEVCPNNVLKPGLGFDQFLKPVMNFEDGFCRPECTRCSQVCPAGAILPITREDKTAISIGHAVYEPELCVVNTDGVKCGNCAAHCPVGAIRLVKQDGKMIPAVNTERCIGCGRCEYVCPSRPVSAIHIEGNQVHHII